LSEKWHCGRNPRQRDPGFSPRHFSLDRIDALPAPFDFTHRVRARTRTIAIGQPSIPVNLDAEIARSSFVDAKALFQKQDVIIVLRLGGWFTFSKANA